MVDGWSELCMIMYGMVYSANVADEGGIERMGVGEGYVMGVATQRAVSN
jgi:hypothetical protein